MKCHGYKFDAWRFYQFCPIGIANEKKDKLFIDTKIFRKKMAALVKAHKKLPISYATFEERDMATLIMEPNFDIIIPKGTDYLLLGNLQQDSVEHIVTAIENNEHNIINKCIHNREWIT